MKIFVKAKPGAKENKVVPPKDTLFEKDAFYQVYTKTKPVLGSATESIRVLLATHFNVSKSSVMLVKGEKSRIKVFEIV